MIIAGTGHRPGKLNGYGEEQRRQLFTFATDIIGTLPERPTLIISGMALGWDTALAEAARAMLIPYRTYVPFKGQEIMWPRETQRIYHDLLHDADGVVTVCKDGYAGWKMQKRNEAMVDACDHVLALWDGSHGGTSNCIAYAKVRAKPVTNVWNKWEKFNGK